MSVESVKKRLNEDIAYFDKYVNELEIELERLQYKISFIKEKREDYAYLLSDFDSK